MKKGFTLAEVLITLTLIGIVAAINIPTLINNIGDQQNKIAWKKTFADISQATNRVIADNGGSMQGVFTDNNTMRDAYLRYLNYTKSCNSDQFWGICWNKNDGTGFKYLNGNGISGWSNRAGTILSNGVMIQFLYYDSTCLNTSIDNYPVCGEINVDVNGFNGPNIIGKDIFFGFVQSTKYYPTGIDGSKYPSSTSCIPGSTAANNHGFGCSALYLYQ